MPFPTALENLNVLSQLTLLPPSQLHDDIPASPRATQTVSAARRPLASILAGRDRRLFVVVGPLLDSRSRGGDGIRPATQSTGR